MNLRWCLTLFLLVSYFPKAHAAVQYYPERKVWVLQAGEATYAMGVNERGELQAIYWGPRVMRDADFMPAHGRAEVASFDLSNTTTPQEYPGWGAELYNEPALKATYANGNRDVVLHFVQQHIDGETLEIDREGARREEADPAWPAAGSPPFPPWTESMARRDRRSALSPDPGRSPWSWCRE